jgi:hypothetical protein
MTVEFALDFIPRRMRELGYGDQYLIRWRHFQVASQEIIRIDADNEFFYLIDPGRFAIVQSNFGTYDATDYGINEMQYEHRGKILFTNRADASILVLFIQVIPTHKK